MTYHVEEYRGRKGTSWSVIKGRIPWRKTVAWTARAKGDAEEHARWLNASAPTLRERVGRALARLFGEKRCA